jgi:hypothetical protein
MSLQSQLLSDQRSSSRERRDPTPWIRQEKSMAPLQATGQTPKHGRTPKQRKTYKIYYLATPAPLQNQLQPANLAERPSDGPVKSWRLSRLWRKGSGEKEESNTFLGKFQSAALMNHDLYITWTQPGPSSTSI